MFVQGLLHPRGVVKANNLVTIVVLLNQITGRHTVHKIRICKTNETREIERHNRMQINGKRWDNKYETTREWRRWMEGGRP